MIIIPQKQAKGKIQKNFSTIVEIVREINTKQEKCVKVYILC